MASLANRAAASLKLQRYASAAEDCTQVLNLQPNHFKAVFRRAQAYEALANGRASDLATFQDYVAKAMADVKKMLVLEPKCKGHKAWLQRLQVHIPRDNVAHPYTVLNLHPDNPSARFHALRNAAHTSLTL